jgi:nucleoside-diphosphate-sugar epimerase
MQSALKRDVDHVLAHTPKVWEELRGERLFITGGTGFVGCWLLESFVWACATLELGASATVLTRDPEAFCGNAPHLASHPAVRLHRGDVRSFPFPFGRYSTVIHAAAPSSSRLNEDDPVEMLDVVVGGTRRTLDFAVACGARRFLLTSSGAVYGKQPSEVSHLSEDFGGAPETSDPRSAYAEGKRAAELLCAIYHSRYGLETKIARGFAFLGPYLPLDVHFAAGNFIRDRLAGGPIRVSGDGTPYRSYLYAADMAIWLWTILVGGQACRPYNVGSEVETTIRQLAFAVAGPAVAVRVGREPVPGQPAERYVPSTRRATAELSLDQLIPLADAIERTLDWHRRASGSQESALVASGKKGRALNE